MYPILFTINGINFYSYGFFVAMAFLTCYMVMEKMTIKKHLDVKFLFEKMLVVLFAGIIGARILYVILYYDQFLSLADIFKIWQGGMVSFGGILGGFVALIILFRKNLLPYLDAFGVAFIAAAAVWRIGCFMAGDHPQIYSDAWFAINHEAPAILMEIICSFIGFIIAYTIFCKNKLKTGYLFFLIFAWYGLTRIVVDQYRLDPVYMSLKSGQWAGIFMIIVALIGVILIKIYKNKKVLNNE